MNQQHISYHRETKSASFGGKTIILEHLTPVLTPEQREKRKQEIEQQLFDVFEKYKAVN